MAIKPKPVFFICPTCSWSKLFAPQSDALSELPPSECPKCGCDDLNVKPAGLLGSLVAASGKVLKS